MRRPVTQAQKAEAIALSNVVGAVEAARRLGWSVKAVRGWAADAGYRPPIEETDELERLYNLAVAKVTVDVAEGRIKGSALMTVAGIARDKLDRAKRWREARASLDPMPEAEPSLTPLTDAASERLTAYIDGLDPDDGDAVRWYLRESINAAIDRESPRDTGRTSAEDDATFARAIDAFTTAVARDLADGSLHREIAEHTAREAARHDQRTKAGRWLDDDVADLLIEAEQTLEEIA